MGSWTTAIRTWAAGETVTAANMNAQLKDFASAFGALTSYTPALTASGSNPTLGTGSAAQGAYLRVQKLCIARFFIQFGSSGTGAGSGTYYVSLPTNSAGYGGTIGVGSLTDNSVTDIRQATYRTQDATKVVILCEGANYATDAVPWTWANNDSLDGLLVYETA